MPRISALPALTVPADDDLLAIVDNSGAITAKITRDDFLTGAALPANTVDGQSIANGSVTYTKVASGFAVQMASTMSTAVATTTALIPFDDTIPQIGEGTEFMTCSITPKSATNILVIQVVAMLSPLNNNNSILMALFQDATANAIAGNISFVSLGTAAITTSLTYSMVAGTTSSTTFRMRAGMQNASTLTFNGSSGARVFGAIPKSSIVITEYKA